MMLAGCADSPSGDSFLTLRGAVDAEVVVEGDDARAVIVWVTAVDGELCLEPIDVPFRPYLLQYEVIIDGPPSLAGQPCVPAPTGLQRARLAWGALVLVDPDRPAPTQIEADPSALLGWFAGEPSTLGEILVARDAVIAAVAERFALIVSAREGDYTDRWCRFGAVLPGLAPYVDRGSDCDGWEPLAEPGVYTELQGIDLSTP